MPPTTDTRHIIVKVSGENIGALKSMAKEMGGITREVKNMSSSMAGLGSKFNSVLGASIMGFGIKNLIDMADSFQLLSARINVLTGGTENVGKVMGSLNDIASRTKGSLTGTAEAFARITATTRDLGIDTTTTLKIVEALQNTFRLSGSTAEEATGGLIQFTQALGLGKLQGQEFRSVMLSNTVYAKLLADSLGVTRGELQKMAEAGKLTTDKLLKVLLDNFDQLQKKGKDLGQTFGQTLTLAINQLSISFGKLSQDLGLSSAFAKGMDWILSKLELITLAVTVLAVSALPALTKAFLAFTASNPLALALTGIVLLSVSVFDNLDQVKISIYKIINAVGEFYDLIIAPLFDGIAGLLGKINPIFEDLFGSLAIVGRRISDWATTSKYELDQLRKSQEKADKRLASNIKDLMAKLSRSMNASANKVSIKDRIESQLAELNKMFNLGKISAEEYFDRLGMIRLDRFNMELAEGKTNLFKLNEALAEMRTQDLTRQFNEGSVSFAKYRQGLKDIEIKKLNDELTAGTLAATQFNDKMLELQNDRSLGWNSMTVGITNYLDKIGTLGKGVADVVTNAFNKLGDAIYEMTKTGKYDFRDFAQSVLDDLGKIVMRAMIIAPLARGILSYLPTGNLNNPTTTDFSGGAPGMGAKLNQFSSGGIVSSPMPFMYGNRKMGIMGEAGPEAILPLTRGSGGELGVRASSAPVIININNQTGSEVSQTERTGPNGEKMIDIMIVSKMRDAIANGSMDKTFQQAFGIRRMGY